MNHVQSKANAIQSIVGPRGSGYNLTSKSAASKPAPEEVADEKANADTGGLPEEMTKGKKPGWALWAGLFSVVLLAVLFFTGKVKF